MVSASRRPLVCHAASPTLPNVVSRPSARSRTTRSRRASSSGSAAAGGRFGLAAAARRAARAHSGASAAGWPSALNANVSTLSIVVSSPRRQVDQRQLAMDRLLVLAQLVLLRLGVRRPKPRPSASRPRTPAARRTRWSWSRRRRRCVTRSSFSPLVRLMRVGEPAAVG